LEWRAILALEGRHRVDIRLKIDQLVGNKPKHHIAGIDTGAAEHPANVHGAEFSEQIADMVGIHGKSLRRIYCAPAASFLAGVSCTDSPQPQAEVWFGFLNTNWAESFSVL